MRKKYAVNNKFTEDIEGSHYDNTMKNFNDREREKYLLNPKSKQIQTDKEKV